MGISLFVDVASQLCLSAGKQTKALTIYRPIGAKFKMHKSRFFIFMFIKTLQFNSITLLLINERNKSLSIGTSYFIHRFHIQTSSNQQKANTKVTTYL